MLFRSLLLGAFAVLTAAQSDVLSFTRVPNPVTDGEDNVLLWSTNNTKVPVEITLKQGPTSALKNVTTLTTAGTGGQYIWHPPTSLADGTDYVLFIQQGEQNNTYGPFTVQGASPAAVSSASAASASANKTMTSTASMGTGTAMHRNSTMSMPHLTQHSMKHTTDTTTHTTASTTTATPTRPVASSSSSAAAVTHISTSSSSIALVLGAVAAILCLH